MTERMWVGIKGDGTSEYPYSPDTDYGSWKVIEENEDGFLIEVDIREV